MNIPVDYILSEIEIHTTHAEDFLKKHSNTTLRFYFKGYLESKRHADSLRLLLYDFVLDEKGILLSEIFNNKRPTHEDFCKKVKEILND